MSTPGDEPGGDYTYDMAHDDMSSVGAEPARRPVDESSTPASAEPVDSDGDYSYDLAHEVPPSSSQG